MEFSNKATETARTGQPGQITWSRKVRTDRKKRTAHTVAKTYGFSGMQQTKRYL
jgi:hypothetical protein